MARQRADIRRRSLSACKMLGLARLRTPTIHHGRHTFVGHTLPGEGTFVEARAAAGHTNVAVTSIYLHVAMDDDGEVGDLFESRWCALIARFGLPLELGRDIADTCTCWRPRSSWTSRDLLCQKQSLSPSSPMRMARTSISGCPRSPDLRKSKL